MQTVLYRNGKRYAERSFTLEKDFESLIINNGKALFGQKAIIIDAKKKLETKALGGTIPDFFLIDFSDIENPEFYLVEVELSSHNFFDHIFPQITKFFAFFRNTENRSRLNEKLHDIILNDKDLAREIKSRIGEKEVFKFIKDLLQTSQNILLVLDDEKDELPEIIQTYTDTWGKMVKVAILKEYTCEGDSILTLSPEFEYIETIDIVNKESIEDEGKTNYTEAFHMDGIEEATKELFQKFKKATEEKIPEVIFNAQRYYISIKKTRNFGFIEVRRKKISLVALLPEEEIRNRIKNYEIVKLGNGVQKFYNGPCAKIIIDNDKYLDEVIELLGLIQR